jgi:hypothetical protein
MFLTFGMSRALQLERRAGVRTILRRSICGTAPPGLGSRVLFQANKTQEDEIILQSTRIYVWGRGKQRFAER